MPKEVPKCELKKTEVTEEYFLNLQAFLADLGLSCLEAQIVLEVYRYPEFYVDTITLEKKIPKELIKQRDFGEAIHNLLASGFLKRYSSKKPEDCVQCDDIGRLVAEQILGQCYSESLRYYPSMCGAFENLKRRRCIDHEHFKKGEQRMVSVGDFKLKITIDKILTSDFVVGKLEDDSDIYGRRLIGRILKCPRCREEIPLDYCYDHKNLYTDDVEVECPKCDLTILLGRALRWAFIEW